MKKEFEGKKLLILGGNPETSALVKVANDMGIKTIVTSFRENDDAKKYAWKASMIDGFDIPGLIALAREEQVDGVLVGVADMLVPSYCKVCDALGFPCYATPEIVNVFAYKDVFKATCERYGVHGIPEYYLDSNLNKSDVDKIKFPVMVKPVDSSSGMGMTVCYSPAELRKAVNFALSVSSKKRFIVERYMENVDDVAIYYTFKDGVCSPSCIFDRYTSGEQRGKSRVNMGSIYPSKHIDNYFKRMHKNAVRMFEDIGIQDGVLLMSGFYENGEFYMYDPGFRLQGEAPHLLMKAIHGFDQREMLIRFALTGSQGDIDLEKEDDIYFRGKAASTLWFLLKEGVISKIEGFENIETDSRIVENIMRLHEGDVIPEEWIGTEKQVLTRLYIVCENKQELAMCIKEYRDKIKVYDQDGNNMLLNGFDPIEVIK